MAFWVQSRSRFHFSILCNIYLDYPRRQRVPDYRTRRNRTQRRTVAFELQIEAIIDTYMGWMVDQGDNGIGGDYTRPLCAEVQGSSDLLVVDMYCELYLSV